ncbi:MAG: 30S ribosomal protein S16 [Patescibacteria group bacterium]|nr:30S ribosomal protein S16 [Patescibacteria group bacterium]
MLTIKLARKGKKGLPIYRLIISEKGRDTYGDSLEILGSYNPHDKKLEVNADRVRYWISVGAQMTGVINNLLIQNKIIEGKKQRVSAPSKRIRVKAAKEVADAKKKALEAKKAEAEAKTKAAEEATKATEAPIVETPAETKE